MARKGGSRKWWLPLVSLFLLVQAAIWAYVNERVPEEYMDEPFHGPQTRKYCEGQYEEWDSKITTFPGLYVLGTAYGWARLSLEHAFLGHTALTPEEACSTTFLRSLNVLLSAATFVVLLRTTAELAAPQPCKPIARSDAADISTPASSTGQATEGREAEGSEADGPGAEGSRAGGSAKWAPASLRRPLAAASNDGLPTPRTFRSAAVSTKPTAASILFAVALALYPLHWFYSFLYYTDVASTLFLLLAHHLCLGQRYGWAGLAGAAALGCRQTNAVWVAFLLGASALRITGMDSERGALQGVREVAAAGATADAMQTQAAPAGVKDAPADTATADFPREEDEQQERSSANSKGDSPGTGEDSPGTGEDSPGTGEDSPGTGEDSAGTGEDSAGTGEDSPGTGEDSPGTGEDSAAEGPPAEGKAEDALLGQHLSGEASKPGVGELSSSSRLRSAVTCPGDATDLFGVSLGVLLTALQRLWQQRMQLLQLWPLALTPVAFAAFLVHNNGQVTVGDKEAHAPVKHYAQILYFGAWSAALLAPAYLGSVRDVSRAVRGALRVVISTDRRRQQTAAAAVAIMALSLAALQRGSLAHPYLLADNRHYTFYLWRRLLTHGSAGRGRVAAAALYAAAWCGLLLGLRARRSGLWVVGFCACLALTLVPAWLLESRYFTPGFYLLALHLPPPTAAGAARLAVAYAVINAVALFMFTRRPFLWGDGSIGRFMW